MMNDWVNGLFELIGGLLLITNCVKLYRDKKVSGINVFPTAFFMCWGVWNLHYYPSLDQWASFAGGIVIVVSNLVWVMMAIYYKYFGTDGLKGYRKHG